MIQPSNTQDQVQNIGKLVLFKNSLIFENTAYQISNITSLWVADHSHTIKHKFPTWIWVAALFGLAIFVYSLQQKQLYGSLIGIALLGLAVYGHWKFKPETPIAKFALGIELNSGRRSLFTAPDMKFVQQAATALLDAVSERHMRAEKTIINFTDRSVHVERADQSIIIGGNVSDSLVENF